MKKLIFILLIGGCTLSKSSYGENEDQFLYSLLFVTQTNIIINTANTIQLSFNIKKGKVIPNIGFFTGTLQTLAGALVLLDEGLYNGNDFNEFGFFSFGIGVSTIISSALNLYNIYKKDGLKTSWNLKPIKIANNSTGITLTLTRTF